MGEGGRGGRPVVGGGAALPQLAAVEGAAAGRAAREAESVRGRGPTDTVGGGAGFRWAAGAAVLCECKGGQVRGNDTKTHKRLSWTLEPQRSKSPINQTGYGI